MFWKVTVTTLALFAATVCGSESANAAFDYGFYNITNNNATNAATGEQQMSMNVSDAGSGRVRFTFTNAGPLQSSITDVYFDDRRWSMFVPSITSLEDGGGVSYSNLATPGNLPGGRWVGFRATSQLTADADAPVQLNGVNPGESLGVVLTLASGYLFNNVIQALELRNLRVGIHVQGFSNGGSESFINNPIGTATPPPPPPPVVPEPSSLALAGMALFGLAFGRRFRKSADA